MSKTAYYFVWMIGMATLFATVGWAALYVIDDRREERERAAARAPLVETSKLAQANNPAAQYQLAQMYRDGKGVSIDDRQAQIWLERAANHGHTEAQYELGISLRDGRGISQDFQSAIRWLRMAAMGGHPLAQYHLGLMYQTGIGTAPDDAQAYMWLNLAAARGVEAAVRPRDTVLRQLSPHQVTAAQAEARRFSEVHLNPSAVLRPPPTEQAE